ncbi:MAG: DUF2817 domain-containing protein [Nitrososphaeria archaeon]|nr:DUF2817 domain-containing protein [Nitrososphaeria archaeon]
MSIVSYHFSLKESFQEKASSVKNDYVKNVLENYAIKNLKSFSYNICGYSVEQKPIYYCKIGNGKENIFIIGGLHGDEPKGTYACLEFIETLLKNNSLTEKYTFTIIPLCNPDGAQNYKRRNSNNIDLNRDFYKISQPETKAIINLFQKHKPIILIDVHESLGSMPLIIYANNSKSLNLATYISLQSNIPAILAANVGQSANYAEKENIYGIILELPCLSWKYGNGTIIIWNIICYFNMYLLQKF